MVGTTEEICDPKRCATADAIRIAIQRAKENLSYDLQIAQLLNTLLLSNKTDILKVERALDILGEIASPGRLFGVLRSALSHDEPEVRSKAALGLARHVDNMPVLERLISDHDPRVRANTIEALWGRKMPEAEAVLQKALYDGHHRVAINAAYALYLIDPAKYIAEVEAFVNHEKQGHRMAAAWLIRKIGDSRHMGLLKTLVRDEAPEVRTAAFKTLAALRTTLGTEAVATSAAR